MLLLKNGGSGSGGAAVELLKKRVDALWKLTHGIAWDTQTDAQTAYTKTVPTGAVAAEIGSIGGKTVVWNQLADAETGSVTLVSGKKYLTVVGGTETIVSGDGGAITVTTGDAVINLTQMFGSGSEPTSVNDTRIAAIHAYLALHPAYNAGQLVSAEVTGVESRNAAAQTADKCDIPVSLLAFLADKGYGWSAGGVYNELDFSTKTYTQRVGAINMGNIAYSRVTSYGAHPFFYATIDRPKSIAINFNSPRYTPYRFASLVEFGDGAPDRSIAANTNSTAPSGRILIRDDAYETAAALKAALDGTALYYELLEPVVYDVSAYIENTPMLTTEAGGTLTFVQDGTELVIPNSVDYLVKLSEVTP